MYVGNIFRLHCETRGPNFHGSTARTCNTTEYCVLRPVCKHGKEMDLKVTADAYYHQLTDFADKERSHLG